MLTKIFEDSDHKLKIIAALLFLCTTLFFSLSANAQTSSIGVAGKVDTLQSTQPLVQKVHGFHCHFAGGHAHRAHCAGHRQCYRKCYPFAVNRFNCRNLLRFCLRDRKTSRAKCYAQYRKCLRRAKRFCKSACSR